MSKWWDECFDILIHHLGLSENEDKYARYYKGLKEAGFLNDVIEELGKAPSLSEAQTAFEIEKIGVYSLACFIEGYALAIAHVSKSISYPELQAVLEPFKTSGEIGNNIYQYYKRYVVMTAKKTSPENQKKYDSIDTIIAEAACNNIQLSIPQAVSKFAADTRLSIGDEKKLLQAYSKYKSRRMKDNS